MEGGGGAGEEVTDFLQRIRELGDRRDREDNERARQLEAEIIAGREARRARRDERARSISPQKDTPATLPQSPLILSPTDDADDFATSTSAALEKLTGRLQEATTSPTPQAEPSARPVPNWQRRERPKSVAHSSLLSRKFIADEVIEDRKDIAERLGQKDPAWFRQTSERLAGSPALRKGAEEEEGSVAPKKELPGMRNERPKEVEKRSREEAVKEVEPEPVPSNVSTPDVAPQRPAATTSTGSYRNRAQTFTSGRFELSKKDLSQPPPMSPSQGRIEDDDGRTPSPTKGYGGFVQSAMLKREGSVNKRWSQQQPQTGTPARTTTVRPKSFHHSMTSRDSMRSQVSMGSSRESSPAPEDHRSYESADELYDPSGRGRATSTSSFVSDASTVASPAARPGQSVRRDSSPPLMSPGKHYESKRWSPTKSSWLESALKKGTDNVPTPIKPSKPMETAPIFRQTPNTSTIPTPHKAVSTPTLTATKVTTPTLTPTKTVPTSTPAADRAVVSPIPTSVKPVATATASSKSSEKLPKKLDEPASITKNVGTPPKPEKLNLARSAFESPTNYGRPASPEKLSSAESSPKIPRSGSPAKVEITRLMGASFAPRLASRSPSPEKLEIGMGKLEIGSPTAKSVADLRAGLRPRAMSGSGDNKEPPPFLNAMQRLRSTKTQNYKAPNELKDRILEGKAHLNATGGPQKTVRPDPLKEQVLSAKTALRNSKDVEDEEEEPHKYQGPVKKLPPLEKSMSVLFPNSESAPKSVAPRLEPTKKASVGNKFNSGLAGMLARGPPPMAGGAGAPRSTASVVIRQSEPTEPAGPLNHITKSRAKGPKRRAPTTAAEVSPPAITVSKRVAKPTSIDTPSTPMKTLPKDEPTELVVPKETATPSETEELVTPAKTKPPTPVKSPLLRGNSSSSLKENLATGAEDTNNLIRSSTPPLVRTSSTKVLLRQSSQGSLTAASPLGSKLQATVEEDVESTPTLVQTPSRQTRDESNGSLGLTATPSTRRVSLSPLTEPTPARPLPSIPPPSPAVNPSKIGMENSQLLSEFFTGPMFRAPKMEFDIIDIISSKPSVQVRRVKTVSMEVSLIEPNGQLTPIPLDCEHIFYDEAMFLCLHMFESFPGQHESEVYLWVGSKVYPGVVEDVQLFARRFADEYDAPVIQIPQGRETANFFEAIGGILVTLRGPYQDSQANASFLLCGRSTIGGVAFDEVNMEVSVLCSGFCYLLRKNGKMYMWKGRGTTPEEIGVAKVVGFEIGQAEINECAEGLESQEFLQAIGGQQSRTSAEYWNLRPNCRKYGTRLFKIDLSVPTGVVEIFPFSQADLDPQEIYVADAYFEFYIVLGSRSQDKRAEFQTALQFAQEYSILAVSLEDRPVIPVTSVILGGAPREFKALFRTWEDAKTPTTWQPTRKPSMRIVGLSEAMEAVGV